MKTKWNEMSSSEKILYMISIVFALIAAAFAVLDLCTDWQYANLGWNIAFALYLGIEAKASWNKSRKIAVTELICAILLVVFALVNQFL